MNRIESLFFRFLSYFGVDPTAGDLAGDLASDAAGEAGPTPEPVAVYLRSPYECEPETWGLYEMSPFEAPRPTPPRRPLRTAPAVASKRRRRRLKLAANRQPTPRGLLSS